MTMIRLGAAAIAAACLLPVAALAQGGAFRVDDAAIGDPRQSQLETLAAWSFGRTRERLVSARFSHTFVSFPPLQLSLGIERDAIAREEGPGHDRRRFWSTTLAPEAKLRLLDLEEHGRLGLALKGGVAWRASLQGSAASSDAGEPLRRLETAFGLAIATFRLSNTVRVNLNGGVERDRVAGRTQPLWGFGAAWQVAADPPFGTTTLVAEAAGIDRGRPVLQAGLRQSVLADRLDFDLVFGRNLSNERASWLVLGFTARF